MNITCDYSKIFVLVMFVLLNVGGRNYVYIAKKDKGFTFKI